MSAAEVGLDGAARLVEYLERHAVNASVVEPGVPTPTVLDAARALNVEPGQIIKSVAFEANTGEVVLVIAPGDRRVDAAKVAALARLEKVKMASPARVLETTGYAVGGVPPVGHPAGLPVILDASLLEREELVGGGGAGHLLLRIAPREVLRVTGGTVGDICQDA